MAVGSGIGASLGIAAESTAGTAVAPTRWLEFNSESLSQEKVIVEGGGLRGGGLFPRTNRRSVTGRNAGGGVSLNVTTSGMGLLFKAMMGTATSAVVTGSAYQQVHTPGDLIGNSLTVQKLIPTLTGSLQAFTYNGCKVTDWELSCAKDEKLTLSLTLDAWAESTAVAAGTPSYSTTTQEFDFMQGALILGGTVSTSGGVTSISGGTAVSGVSAATVTGTTGIRTASDNRYINGKVEQVQNAWRSVGGTLTTDFISRADIYDLFNADTAAALRLTFTQTTAITGSTYPTVEVLIPSVTFTGETPQVGGTDVVSLSAGFVGRDDGANPAVQIRYVTSDASVS